MSTIDEIEVAPELCARRPDRMNFSALKVMIAAALADARREGAEQMRAQLSTLTPEMADAACWRYTAQSAGDYARAVSASPLPTGERRSVLLTDEQQAAEIERLNDAQSMSPASAAHGEIALRWRVQDDGLYAVDMMVSNLKTENEAHAAMVYVESLIAGDENAWEALMIAREQLELAALARKKGGAA